MRARLDQHYLTDPGAADSIVSAARVRPGAEVVEIGPGKGILTERLVAAGGRVTAVELDVRLAESLERRFQGALRIVRADWLRLDLSTLPAPALVVSNLPYSVASPILQTLLDWPGCSAAVLMFQKEVAERILAGPGSKAYGLLSLSVRLKADAAPVCGVPRTSFSPMPTVDSAVVRLERLGAPRLPEGLSEADFFRAVKAAFQHRRKTAAKSLSISLPMERAAVEAALDACGIPAKARAEEIPFEGFIELAKRLSGKGC